MRPVRLMWPGGHTRAQPKISPSCPLQPALPFLICQAPPTSGPWHLPFPWPGTASPYGYSQGSLPSGLRSDVSFLNQVSQIVSLSLPHLWPLPHFASHSTCLHLLDPCLSLTVRQAGRAIPQPSEGQEPVSLTPLPCWEPISASATLGARAWIFLFQLQCSSRPGPLAPFRSSSLPLPHPT